MDHSARRGLSTQDFYNRTASRQSFCQHFWRVPVMISYVYGSRARRKQLLTTSGGARITARCSGVLPVPIRHDVVFNIRAVGGLALFQDVVRNLVVTVVGGKGGVEKISRHRIGHLELHLQAASSRGSSPLYVQPSAARHVSVPTAGRVYPPMPRSRTSTTSWCSGVKLCRSPEIALAEQLSGHAGRRRLCVEDTGLPREQRLDGGQRGR